MTDSTSTVKERAAGAAMRTAARTLDRCAGIFDRDLYESSAPPATASEIRAARDAANEQAKRLRTCADNLDPQEPNT